MRLVRGIKKRMNKEVKDKELCIDYIVTKEHNNQNINETSNAVGIQEYHGGRASHLA